MAIVDVNRVASMQPIRNLLAILAGQYFGTLAESRTDTCESAALPDDEIELAARYVMSDRRERCGGLFGPGSGSRGQEKCQGDRATQF